MREILKYENYSDDEPVGLAAIPKSKLPGPIEDKYWDYIPQAIFHRVLCIGAAYNLHYSQIVDHVVDTVFDTDQCTSFENSLLFIADIVADNALNLAIKKIMEKVKIVKYNKDYVLVISPP